MGQKFISSLVKFNKIKAYHITWLLTRCLEMLVTVTPVRTHKYLLIETAVT